MQQEGNMMPSQFPANESVKKKKQNMLLAVTCPCFDARKKKKKRATFILPSASTRNLFRVAYSYNHTKYV